MKFGIFLRNLQLTKKQKNMSKKILAFKTFMAEETLLTLSGLGVGDIVTGEAVSG